MRRFMSVMTLCSTIIVATFASMAVANADCSNPSCSPGPGQVCLFQHSECNGLAWRVYADTVWPALSSPGLDNDQLSSFLLGNNTELTICDDSSFEGYCDTYRRDDAYALNGSVYTCLEGSPWGDGCWGHVCNDWTSSLRVVNYRYSPSASGSLTNYYCLFPSDYQCTVFTGTRDGVGQCRALGIASYPSASEAGLPNDSISSILCGAHAQAYIYQDINYGGTVFSSPYINALSLGSADNRTSSIVVVAR
jgi:hypothetical protein